MDNMDSCSFVTSGIDKVPNENEYEDLFRLFY